MSESMYANWIGYPVVVTTSHRGIYFGWLQEVLEGGNCVRLSDARHGEYFTLVNQGQEKGNYALASTGPQEGSRIGPKTRRTDMSQKRIKRNQRKKDIRKMLKKIKVGDRVDLKFSDGVALGTMEIEHVDETMKIEMLSSDGPFGPPEWAKGTVHEGAMQLYEERETDLRLSRRFVEQAPNNLFLLFRDIADIENPAVPGKRTFSLLRRGDFKLVEEGHEDQD